MTQNSSLAYRHSLHHLTSTATTVRDVVKKHQLHERDDNHIHHHEQHEQVQLLSAQAVGSEMGTEWTDVSPLSQFDVFNSGP